MFADQWLSRNREELVVYYDTVLGTAW